jgi:hypothetical protein
LIHAMIFKVILLFEMLYLFSSRVYGADFHQNLIFVFRQLKPKDETNFLYCLPL